MSLQSEPRADPPQRPTERSEYCYEPLPRGCIRLLHFWPNRHNRGLRISIEHVNLHAAPRYVALSYAWGDPTATERLRVRSRDTTGFIRVTPRLKKAVYALSAMLCSEGLLFWADGVCIDQSNLAERSEQVAQMEHIYRNAEYVAVWLGSEVRLCEGQIQHLEEWADILQAKSSPAPAPAPQAQGWDGDPRRVHCQNPLFYGHGENGQLAWNALLGLLNATWWTRTWVCQEAILARRLYMCFDGAAIPFEWIGAVREVRRALLQHPCMMGTVGSVQVHADTMISWIRSSSARDYSLSDQPLLEVLRQLRCFSCADPRDKVYAGLGIATDVAVGDLVPDYALPIEDVYVQVPRFCLQQSFAPSRTDFLGHALQVGYEDEVSGRLAHLQLPSWAPDWSSGALFWPLHKTRSGGSGSEPVYRAGSDRQLEAEISGRTLEIKGFVLDLISSVMDCPGSKVSGWSDLKRRWKPEDGRRAYRAGGDYETAWLRCLVADAIHHRDRFVRRGHYLSPQAFATAEGKQEAQESLETATTRRRLFLTETGFMGLGPGGMKAGDDVCLFYGSPVFYALRRAQSGSHAFLGEAYVHGLMDGEAVSGDIPVGHTRVFKIV